MTAGLLLAFLGYLLIYAGVKGVHPWAPIVEAFGGRAPIAPGRAPKGYSSYQAGATQAGAGVTPTGGLTRAAAAAKAAIERTYPDLVYLGGYDCRRVKPHDRPPAPDDPWSEHAFWNAIDFGGSAQAMGKLVVWANLPHNRLRYKINDVIPPGPVVNAVHIDFHPAHTGQTPPCAGAGGS